MVGGQGGGRGAIRTEGAQPAQRQDGNLYCQGTRGVPGGMPRAGLTRQEDQVSGLCSAEQDGWERGPGGHPRQGPGGRTSLC